MPDIISDIERREGGGVMTNDPADKGGRTQYGISERSNPEAWLDGKVTEAEAREIYERKYIKYPKLDQITDPALFRQLVDYGVVSGSGIAIMKLQAIVGADADGDLGPQTLGLLATFDPTFVNNQLVVARVLMIGRLVQKVPSDLKYLSGWLVRALSFLR